MKSCQISHEQQKAKSCAISCTIFYLSFVPFISYFIIRSLMMPDSPRLEAISQFWLPINLAFWCPMVISVFVSLTLMWKTYLAGNYKKSREIFWAIPILTCGALVVCFYAIPVLLFSFTGLVEILKGP